MKSNLLSMSLISAMLITSISVQANDIDLDEVTMEVSKENSRKSHRIGLPMRETIMNYMLKQGDITQDEIDQLKSQRDTDRAELKALKDSGDKEAFMARKEELKAQRQERRQTLKSYVKDNDELKEYLRETRQKKREERENRRTQQKDKRNNPQE